MLCRRIFIQPPNPENESHKDIRCKHKIWVETMCKTQLADITMPYRLFGSVSNDPNAHVTLVLFVSNRFSFRSSRLMAHAAELAFFQLLLPVGSQMSPAGQAPQPAPRKQQQWQPVKRARTNGQNHRHVPRRGKGRKASTTTS